LCFEIGFDRLDGGTGSEAADTWVVVADTLASPWEVSGASWLKSMRLISVPDQLQVKVHSSFSGVQEEAEEADWELLEDAEGI